MTLKQLGYFCATVDAGSAVLAATRLYVAPTAISMQISQLEEELGGELFDRSRRPMELTPLGQYFYPRAKGLLAESRLLEESSRRVAAGLGGMIAIGYTRSSIFSVLPQAIRTFRKSHPDVHFELLTMLSEHQPENLRAGRIQVGISRFLGGFKETEGVKTTKLLDDPFVVALPIDHPFAKRRSICARELDGLPLITYPRDPLSQFAQHVVRMLRDAGGNPMVGHEAIEIHSALGLVASALGYCVVGKSVSIGNRTDVRFVRLDDVAVTAEVVALTRQDEHSQVVTRFTEVLKSQAAAA